MKYSTPTYNENYTTPDEYIPLSPNLINKRYIDDWLSRNYPTLWRRFRRQSETITKKGYSPTDILHETIVRLYIHKRKFRTQADCDEFLNNFFRL